MNWKDCDGYFFADGFSWAIRLVPFEGEWKWHAEVDSVVEDGDAKSREEAERAAKQWLKNQIGYYEALTRELKNVTRGIRRTRGKTNP